MKSHNVFHMEQAVFIAGWTFQIAAKQKNKLKSSGLKT